MPALALAMISIFFARAVPAIAEEHFPEKHSGIFQVSSSYNSTQTEVGTGFLVSYPAQSSGEKERAFLYTCAHLTGGSDVKINGVPLESLAKGRRTDTFHDVDLIEVDPGLLDGNAFATFSPTSSPEALNNPETIPVAEGVDTKTRLWSLAVNEASLAAWKKGKHSVLNVDYDGKNPAFALVPRWSDKAQAEASKPSQKKNWEFGTGGFRTLEKTYTFIGSSIWTPGRIAPGMSCSPLVDSENRHSQELVVRGMGTEFKNHMAGSTFASDRLLLATMRDYLDNAPNMSIPAQWKSQNGLLYLQLDDHRAEIVPSKPAGNGISTPPGNGISTPPGRGKSLPKGCNPRSLESQSDWEKIGSPPAILWNDKAVMGFLIRPSPTGKPVLVFPDHTGIELRIKAEKLGFEITDIPFAADILSYFDDRMPGHSKSYNAVHMNATIQKTSSLKSPEAERTPARLEITLYGPPPKNDPIHFFLNEKGALESAAAEGKNYFVPVVEVKGKSGQVYLVNLTNLFHTDASLLHVPTSYIPKAGPLEIADAFSDSPKQEIAMVRSQFKAALNFLARENPGLSYRAKCGEDEFSLSFDSRESLENVGVCTEGNNPSVDLKELETLPEIIFLLEK